MALCSYFKNSSIAPTSPSSLSSRLQDNNNVNNMPPNEDVPVIPTKRRFSTYYVPQAVYLGFDIEVVTETKKVQYAISVHDGSYTTDYYAGELQIECDKNATRRDLIHSGYERLLEILKLYCRAQHYKVQIIALSTTVDKMEIREDERPEHTVSSSFWREMDAIPFRVCTHGDTPDERASAAVRKAVMWMSPQYPGNIPRISVGFRHEVEVDFNGIIHLVDLVDYQDTVCKDTWRVLHEVAQKFKDRKLKVSFFNSTPQGGGVALMRHALLRLYRLLNIDVHWYVARPKPEVFDITKRKFHNVLQGVAPPETRLEERDMQMFTDWSNDNVERFWLGEKGPIRTSDVIVVDDPQLVGIIPHIRKHSPRTRIIFRSHIEMRADLIREYPEGPQATTWNFLWSFIKHADLFLAHPIDNFVPDVVPRRNVAQLPATTDPLDGLNKPLDNWSREYYKQVFNRVCMDQGANEVDWVRPYIVQVARFDPSKGIPDVLESYRQLRIKLDEQGVDDMTTPQLVICGHGSVDDPDGTVIYEQTYNIISGKLYATIASDIIVARLPPSDQLLDLIISNARCALQLSHREGFEVKVTEALHVGVPVVAYQAGGIPLQIEADKDGFLVPIGDTAAVADRLYKLVTDDDLRAKMSAAAHKYVTEEYFTVWNGINWLHLFNELTNERSDEPSGGLLDVEATFKRNAEVGNNTKVSDHWRKKYNYNPQAA